MLENLKLWWSNFKTDPKSSLVGVMTILGLILTTLWPASATGIQDLLGKFSTLIVDLVIFITALFSIIGTTKPPAPPEPPNQ